MMGYYHSCPAGTEFICHREDLDENRWSLRTHFKADCDYGSGAEIWRRRFRREMERLAGAMPDDPLGFFGWE